jgi:glycosyltransferase involved in cell wall biosynthesis
MMKVLVIVPAYNEEESIAAVIHELREHFPEGDIVVVNDGSGDGTSGIARGLGVNVIDLPYNLGIGGAMQTGFRYAVAGGYDAAIQFDGDGQHNAEEIGKIFRPHEKKNADLVVGSRFLSEGGFTSSLQRRLGAKILSFVVSALIRKRITDTTSGFRLYSRRAFEFFASTYPEDYPEVEAFILAHKKGLAMEEVPAEISPRQFGKVLLAIFVDLLKRIE